VRESWNGEDRPVVRINIAEFEAIEADIIAIEPNHITNPQLTKHREPSHVAEADIDNGFGLDER
jgi:hypothetical protein